MIDKLSVEHAASILSKYLKFAKDKKAETAEKEIKKVMTVFQELYDIANKHVEVKDA